ncbi:peroxisomal membrane protein 2-like [Macrobrachium nipponense]|uniref:peroxisomal membrane protein 2-like n=1 Tax=Macrobrachium nipponense TaxID=159736 RepID=UPI0030C8A035
MTVLSVLENGLQVYNLSLYRNPLITKATTSAITCALGEILSQLITKQPKISLQSASRYAVFGFVVTGPLAHYFYKFLEKVVPPTSKGASLKRLLLDRLGFAPLLLLLSLYVLSRMEGKSHLTCQKELQMKYWTALKMNWKVWTPIQFINVNYVPQEYRVLFANFIAIFWIMYIGMKRRQAAEAAAKAAKEE